MIQLTIKTDSDFNSDLLRTRLCEFLEEELKGYWDFDVHVEDD